VKRVLVVGAGIAGLATAHAIRRGAERQGIPLRVRVLESGSRPGGRLRTTRDAGWTIEWAASAIQGTEGAAWRVAEEVGLASERVIADPAASRRYLARGGRLHPIPTDPLAFLRFGALSPPARLRVLLEPLAARRVARDESVHEFGVRHLGREAATVLLGSVVRGVFAGDARRLSLDAAFPLLREMERKHRSLLLAAGAAVRGKRGAPNAAQARRTLWSFRGGMESLVEALARPLGAALELRAGVLSLTPRSAGGYEARLASGVTLEADEVVVAVPPAAAASLLRPLDVEVARDLAAIPTAGVAVVALGFPRESFRSPPDGFGFLVPPEEPIEILGALYESNLFPGRAPPERVLVRVMIGGAERPDLSTRRDDELVALAMNALDRTLGLKHGPERTWVVRQEAAIPQYAVGHRERMAGVSKRLDALPGITLTGNGYRGVSVPHLIEDAERAAERILRRT
jgi:oxygen-dependent protoporphyrinogen oxidase